MGPAPRSGRSAVARLPGALEITFRPAAAWDAIRAADPHWSRSLLAYALPLALLPAVAWPLGQACRGELALLPQAIARSFFSTLALALASIVVLAAAFYVLMPFFGAARRWAPALALAAFASTPVLLSGALLVLPALVVACVAACVHCFALCYLGAQRLLGCPESEAAFFVAAACMLALVGSLVLGGLCSAAGLI